MAVTRLSDVIVPEVYSQYMAVNSPEVTRFFDSGVVTRNEILDSHANSGGNVAHLPFWRDLDPDNEPNIGSDDPAQTSTPDKITAGKQRALNAYLNQSWSTMDLSGELAGSDPMARILQRTNTYWARQWQRRLVASCVGVMLSNIANDDSDMVVTIGNDAEGSPTDDNLFGGEAYIDAELTLGDQIGTTTAIGMHSQVYGRARKLDLIEFVRESDAAPAIPTYMGKRVIVDDGLPVVAGENRLMYTTVLFGPGAFGYGVGQPNEPVEVERKPDQGNGAGAEILYERRTWLLHPFGFAFDDQKVAGLSATLAELRDPDAWSRVVERKNVPLAFLRTNG